jgi:superfamily II DNA or RNA helicase
MTGMVLKEGLYEQLITKLISNKLEELKESNYFISTTVLDRAEASRYLSQYLAETITYALNSITGDDDIVKKIALSNNIIQYLIQMLPGINLSENLIENEGKLLQAVVNKLDFAYPDVAARIKEIMPYTRLSQSELFTGSNAGISLEAEIKKEIRSADEICWLVSFIKFSGIRIFKNELEEFTNSGKKLKVITTTYMGATDVKAVEFLAGLKNTEVKVSYNKAHERLHAKAYLFMRNSGFDTGYIGSSNLSRSALTNGLEWNLKVTTREVGHIIGKFKKTFETYWADKEFEYYRHEMDRERLRTAIHEGSADELSTITTFFDLKPYPYQQEILEQLKTERQLHLRNRNLLVAATGTGKTVISAFDYRRFKEVNTGARLLFVAHKKEILIQAQETFRHVLRDANFGALWVDGLEPRIFDAVFASIQTLNNRLEQLELSPEYYDFIIVDEVHHIAADSYRPILEKFNPQVMLGLTATPERMDGSDILADFCNVIAAEIRLPEAMNRKLLCPFQYFAVSDSVDLNHLSWSSGRYESKELTRIYTADDRRVAEIISNCEKYLTNMNDVRALGFCVSTDHAKIMAEKFMFAGLKADYLTSENASSNRDSAKRRLRSKEINYLFVVDIFNEGVDVPELDTVLFLRPTESLTIFLQQLGRGLRLAEGKECLTVLDFVGNANPEYDFEHKFRSLVGRTHTSIAKEIEDDFPHLPLGCSIILEPKAKEVILKNIKAAMNLSRMQILSKLINFKHQSALPLTLNNFLEFHHLSVQDIYKRGSWSRLCAEAKVNPTFKEPHESELVRCIGRLIQCSSTSYFKFILTLIDRNFKWSNSSEEERLFLLMFHYDVWLEAGSKMGFATLEESLGILRKNPVMLLELQQVLRILIQRVNFLEQSLEFNYPMPLKLHARYNRDQILVGLQFHTFLKKSSNREGIALNKKLNSEALFVTLKKSEKDYSPTTLYDDYAISENLFHWQSQNRASPDNPSGQAYILQSTSGRQILLFVREQGQDEYRNTMSYVFLGKAWFVSSTGAKPMNIEWKLEAPMPAYLWRESGKLAVG